jgi:glyceraldehyde-3-phosphate dehydrogenase (NAD(P))
MKPTNAVGKIAVIVLCLQLTVPASSYAYLQQGHLRPRAALLTTKDGGTPSRIKDELAASIPDGGSFFYIKILAEGFRIGKDPDVGQSARLSALMQSGIDGTLLGHSAWREERITQLIKGGTDREHAESMVDQEIGALLSEYIATGTGEITLCIGAKKKVHEGETEATPDIVKLQRQLGIAFGGIDREKIEAFYVRGGSVSIADENPSLIGTGTAASVKDIVDEHTAILDFMSSRYARGTIDYGASADDNNIDSIMAIKDANGRQLVHGVLFASAGLNVERFLKVADGVQRAAIRDNTRYSIKMNFKAYGDIYATKTGQAQKTPIDEYVEAIYLAVRNGRIDPSRVNMEVADIDLNIESWKKEVARAAEDAARSEWAYDQFQVKVIKSETVGSFTKEIIGPADGDNRIVFENMMKKRFGGRVHEGENFIRISRYGRAIAMAKENPRLQTMKVIPLMKMVGRGHDSFYADILEFASLVTAASNKTLEIIMERGNRMESVLSGSDTSLTRQDFTMGNLSGTKYWWGRHKDFQMEFRTKDMAADARPTMVTFKKSWKRISGWRSLIVQPKYTAIVNGYGTIGAKVALALRESGFFVEVTARSVKPESIDADEKGFPLILTDTKNAADFTKNGIKTIGTLEEVLARGGVDIVFDCTPGKVGADNVKNLYAKYPDLKVVLQGGEKASKDWVSFSSSSNYDAAINKKLVRVVSCNTTAMARIYGPVLRVFKDVIIDNTAFRRAADPNAEESDLPPDSASLSPSYHHKDDFATVLTEEQLAHLAAINTPAGMIPTTHFHFHTGTIRGKGLTLEALQQILRKQSRVGLVEFDKFEFKTNVLFGIFASINAVADASQPYIIACQVTKSDIPGDFKITFAVPQESDVVPEGVNAAQAMFGLMSKDAAIRLVDEVMGINEIKAGVEKRLSLKSVVAPSREGQPRLKTIDDFSDADLQEGWVVLKVDNNVSDGNGKITDDERIQRMMPTLLKLKARGARAIIVSHNGRPDGKVVPAYSMGPVAQRAQEIADELGYAMKIGFVADSVTSEGLDVQKVKNYLAGTKDDFVYLENCRFAKDEQTKDEARADKLARDYASLNNNGFAFNNAFGAWQSAGDVTVVRMFRYFRKFGVGDLITEEYKNLKGYVKSIYGLDFGGGPKLDEKIQLLLNIIPNMIKGGFIHLGSGPAPAFLMARDTIKVANSIPAGSVDIAKKILETAEAHGIRLEIPEDFIACDTDVMTKADAGATWVDKHQLPPGAHVYRVTLEQLKQGTFYVTSGEESGEGSVRLDASKLFLFGIGPATREKFVQNALSIPQGFVHFGNGPFGVVEISELGADSVAYVKQGPGKAKTTYVAVGGNTTELFKDAKVKAYFSTGGKAGEGVARGDKLTAESGLEDIQAADDIGTALPVDKDDAYDLIQLGNKAAGLSGVKSLGGFIRAVNAAGMDRKAVIVFGPEYVQTNGNRGLRNVIKELTQLPSVQIAMYGEKAENTGIFFGEKSILTAGTAVELTTKLNELNLAPSATVFIGTGNDIDESAYRFQLAHCLVSSGIVALDAATAVNILSDSAETQALLGEFGKSLASEKVIDAGIAKELDSAINSFVTGVFEFKPSIKPTDQVAMDIDRIAKESQEIWDQV